MTMGHIQALNPEFTASWGNVLINGKREKRPLHDKNRTPEPPQFLLTTRRPSWEGSLSVLLVDQQFGCDQSTRDTVKHIGRRENYMCKLLTVFCRHFVVGSIKDWSAGLFVLVWQDEFRLPAYSRFKFYSFACIAMLRDVCENFHKINLWKLLLLSRPLSLFRVSLSFVSSCLVSLVFLLTLSIHGNTHQNCTADRSHLCGASTGPVAAWHSALQFSVYYSQRDLLSCGVVFCQSGKRESRLQSVSANQ